MRVRSAGAADRSRMIGPGRSSDRPPAEGCLLLIVFAGVTGEAGAGQSR
jgi:hypothetical protein